MLGSPAAHTKPLCVTVAANRYATRYLDCLISQRLYCARHGFGFVAATRMPWSISAAQASWFKLALLKAALKTGHPTAFFDADCFVRWHAPSFLEALGDALLAVAPGKSGRPNAGVILAAPTKAAISNLDILISRADEKLNVPLVQWENAPLIHYFSQLEGVKILPHPLWNNNSYFDRSSYVQHYAKGDIRAVRDRRILPRTLNWLAQKMPPARRLTSDLASLPTSVFLHEYAEPFAADLICARR